MIDEIRALDSTATDGELRSYLAQFLFSGEDVFNKIRNLSGGEKSRVALAKIIYAGSDDSGSGRTDKPPGYCVARSA